MCTSVGGRAAAVFGIAFSLLAPAAGPWASAADEEPPPTSSPTESEAAEPSPASTSTSSTTTTTTTSTTTSTTTTPSTSTTATEAPEPQRGVTENKTYTVDITGTTGAAPDAWAGDLDATLSVEIANTSPSQSLGSANLTVPAPFTLVGSPDDTVPGGPVVEVRNLALAPGDTAVVTLTVRVDQCTPGPTAAFDVAAKQSNDFRGVGNDFTLTQPSDLHVDVVGTCTLSWLAGPTDAERGATITSEAFSTSGPPLAVEVLDGGVVDRTTVATGTVTLAAANPSVGSPELGGTIAADIDAAGLATFAPGPTLAPSAFDYVLSASSPDLIGSGPSAPFDIVDEAANCPAGSPCVGSASSSVVRFSATATFGAGSQNTHLQVSINAADVPPFECAGYPRDDRAVSQFVFSDDLGGDRVGTFSMTITDAPPPANRYEVCWAAPYPFTTKSGEQAQIGASKPGSGEPLFVGLLPDCPRRGATEEHLPCVGTRDYNARERTIRIVVEATGDDPWKYV